MGNLIYLTLEGNIQGQISAGCSSQASVGNRHQLGHENAIFVFSLTQAESGSKGDIHHHGLHFCKLLDKSSPLLSNAINNNERLKMTFDIYRINRYGRMEKYYLIELRGATIQAISLQSKMNDMDYEYITVDYDYILCRHLIAGTEFDYLLTPDNDAHLFPAVQKTMLPADPPERKVTLVLGIFFDGTGNNAVNTRNMLEALTAQHFDINDPDAESILTRNASEKMGVSGIINAISAGMGKISYRGAPAGKTRFLGIMDTVAAVGTLANGLDPHSADTGNVNIHLRPGVAQKVFHLTALHECRYNFALNSVAPAWPELALPGVHSDIGGGYLPQLREDLFLTRPQVDTLPQNQSGAQSHIYPQTMAQLQVLEHSPAIMPIIRTNAITPEVWEDDFAPPDRYSQPQKRAFAALTLRHRIVSFDWSKVALRVMVDAATEAGAVFDDINQIPKHRLPDELKPFCEHARLMGKAARQHVAATSFAPEDVDIIARKYIHCSAHWNAVELKQSGELQGGASASETISFVNRPDKNWIRTIYNMDGKK
ncbi:type VI secretion system tube protein Hcp [Salmonella enterica]|uniref:Type VI secretion system tube protein Hcp n=1 Tax=Salmonella enterica subsp. houtenae serovar 44:z4,z24:- TaxID=1967610 RepID=A0A737NVD0_SALHO|nr:type VI secretion system tube protein Hcp [Salmonella enterica]HAE7152952.1 type VI secretion system tube protein Hcp [Salmonella enterica subsp. houtenae serovar 44:z4,z24:-]HAE8352998.1 type VI secretion system tube protein Hcp [Salmonella enterica subsp. houtenae serovar 44:z4,z24:-]